MIKIRYSELPTGIHVAVRRRRGATIIYLLPGLTPAERRAALARVRSSARMRRVPKISGGALFRAVAADRTRTVLHSAGAAARRHPVPLLSLVTAFVASVLVCIVATFVLLPPHQSPSYSGARAGDNPVTPQQLRELQFGSRTAPRADPGATDPGAADPGPSVGGGPSAPSSPLSSPTVGTAPSAASPTPSPSSPTAASGSTSPNGGATGTCRDLLRRSRLPRWTRCRRDPRPA